MDSWRFIGDNVENYLKKKQDYIDTYYTQKIIATDKRLAKRKDLALKYLKGELPLRHGGSEEDNKTESLVKEYTNNNITDIEGILLFSIPHRKDPFRGYDQISFPIFMYQFCRNYPGIPPPVDPGTAEIKIQHIRWDNNHHKEVHTIEDLHGMKKATTDFMQRLSVACANPTQIPKRVVILVLGHGTIHHEDFNVGTIHTPEVNDTTWITNNEYIQYVEKEIMRNASFQNILFELIFSHCYGHLHAGAKQAPNLNIRSATSGASADSARTLYYAGTNMEDAHHADLEELCFNVKQEVNNIEFETTVLAIQQRRDAHYSKLLEGLSLVEDTTDQNQSGNQYQDIQDD